MSFVSTKERFDQIKPLIVKHKILSTKQILCWQISSVGSLLLLSYQNYNCVFSKYRGASIYRWFAAAFGHIICCVCFLPETRNIKMAEHNLEPKDNPF